MKRSEIHVGGIYANSKGDRFRLVTGEGEEFAVFGQSQTDADCVQVQTVRKKADGSFVVALGNYDADGLWRAMWRPARETYNHCTRTSMATWAHRQATPAEARKVRAALKG